MYTLKKRTGHPTALRLSAGNDAFTLIEVILAVLILSVGVTVLLTAASRCLAVFKMAKLRQNAIWVLDLAELEHPLIATNDVKRLEVDETEYGDGFVFSRVIEDDEDEDGLYLVRQTVKWRERGGYSSEDVVRYVLQLKD